jgi:hypothetical protein
MYTVYTTSRYIEQPKDVMPESQNKPPINYLIIVAPVAFVGGIATYSAISRGSDKAWVICAICAIVCAFVFLIALWNQVVRRRRPPRF